PFRVHRPPSTRFGHGTSTMPFADAGFSPAGNGSVRCIPFTVRVRMPAASSVMIASVRWSPQVPVKRNCSPVGSRMLPAYGVVSGGTVGSMAAITKHETTLADGRDLIYFDDADTTLSTTRSADAR